MAEYKKVCTKEFYPLKPEDPTIGLLLMLKNEKKRIQVTLDSVVGSVDALIVYDTGSTDNTMEIVQEFCEKHRINLYMIQGEFVDFATSRNVSLDFADTVPVNYILLMDCNDELRGGDKLRLVAKEMLNKENTGFLVCQQWWSGMLDKYYNMRFVKNRTGWRYRGSVHEWLKDTTSSNDQPRFQVIKIPDTVVLYQDRTKDDDKSGKRFHRDRELLLRDHARDPKEPRTLFYLAQTCQCLELHDEALYYSKLRLELEGFQEEKFHSYMRCGMSCLALGHPWEVSMGWFMKAYQHTPRVEPMIRIADYYRHLAARQSKDNYHAAMHNWRLAYMFIDEACRLEYPHHLILFIDSGMYEYYRWHVMGVIGFYVGAWEQGKDACKRAIAHGLRKELDEKNLQFYLDEEAKKGAEAGKRFLFGPPPQVPEEMKKDVKKEEKKQVQFAPPAAAPVPDEKAKFMKDTIDKIRSEHPTIPMDHVRRRALAMWKKQKKGK